jgi:hypothetical protein
MPAGEGDPMDSSERIVRRDLVEIHKDKTGRVPALVLIKERGALVLVEHDGQRSVVLVREAHPSLVADLADVRCFGNARGPYGIRAAGERTLRLGFGSSRVIVMFTGEVSDLSGSLTDMQVGRLTGEFDLLDAAGMIGQLWDNRGFWGRSLEAANAWRHLLIPHAGPSRTVHRASPRRSTSGGAGVGARYSDEFRRQAVATARASDKSVSSVARDLEISPTTLRRWIGE